MRVDATRLLPLVGRLQPRVVHSLQGAQNDAYSRTKNARIAISGVDGSSKAAVKGGVGLSQDKNASYVVKGGRGRCIAR